MMIRELFIKKFDQIRREKPDCARAEISSWMQIAGWVGTTVQLNDDFLCTTSCPSDIYLHIAALNNSISETDILYEIDCKNEALRFKKNKTHKYSDVLHTIPHYSNGSIKPQATHDCHILECNPKSVKPQEIIEWEYLHDSESRDNSEAGSLRITIEIKKP